MQSVPKKPKTIEITYCQNFNAPALSWTHKCIKIYIIVMINTHTQCQPFLCQLDKTN